MQDLEIKRIANYTLIYIYKGEAIASINEVFYPREANYHVMCFEDEEDMDGTYLGMFTDIGEAEKTMFDYKGVTNG